MRIILCPELVDYIYGYYGHYFTDIESKANWHHFAWQKSKNGTSPGFVKHFTEKGMLSTDPKVLCLLENGFQQFKENVASRIWEQHQHELNLNLCPKCGKIARTSEAKQCRFCYHDWH